MTFAATLKTLRQDKHLSQGEAAKLCGVSIRTWQEWEQKRRTPPEYTQAAVIKQLEEYKI